MTRSKFIRIEYKKIKELDPRQDWELDTCYENRYPVKTAQHRAKQLSKRKDIAEVLLTGYLDPDNDPSIQEWYENGKLTFKMF